MEVTEIISNYKLEEFEIKEIVKKFPEISESSVVNRVDEKIRGGFIIKHQGKVIDFSLLSRLKNFKKAMYEID